MGRKKISDIEAFIAANPHAKPHGKIILATLKSLEQLEKVGISNSAYRLASPYGDDRSATELSHRSTAFKMSYTD